MCYSNSWSPKGLTTCNIVTLYESYAGIKLQMALSRKVKIGLFYASFSSKSELEVYI